MFTVDTSTVAEEVRKAIVEISRNIEPTCLAALERARDEEKVPAARFALTKMCENARFAAQTGYPVCQDTGMCVVFVEIGKDVLLTGALLQDAIDGAVREGYADLRKSVLDPVTRVNTGTNAPAVVHTDFVPGDEVKVSVMLKGFGSENMSALYMLNPAQGLDTAKDLIVETVARAASNPCPPVIVGVGLGGTFELCAKMSKQALFRKIGSANPDPQLDAIERELMERVNSLGVGAQGFGGKTTALGIFIRKYPTHISSLPVAVNILCHCSRAKVAVIGKEGVRYE